MPDEGYVRPSPAKKKQETTAISLVVDIASLIIKFHVYLHYIFYQEECQRFCNSLSVFSTRRLERRYFAIDALLWRLYDNRTCFLFKGGIFPVKYMNKVFYGWFVVAACFVILFSLHGVIINTFGVFVKPVSEGMGWGRGEFSMALAAGALAMAFGAPFVGRMIDRFGAPKTMLSGCLCCGLGMVVLCWATMIWHFYLLFILIGLGLSAATTIPVSLVIANWFNQKRGIAMGTAFMGTSAGGMIMNPINALLLQKFGWRDSYLILGIVVMLSSIPLVLFIIRTRPSEMNLLPDGKPSHAASDQPLTGHTLKQAIGTASFWFIAANMLLTTGMANSIGVHCIPFLTDVGHSPLFAATAYGLSMGFMTLGKVASGFCADRWGARQTFTFSAVMTAIGIGILLFASPVWVVLLFVFVFGFPQGAPLTLTPLVTADCHGLRSFGSIFGLATLFSILGAAIGPVIVGYMYDSSGSYTGGFILLIAMTLLGAYCIHMAKAKEQFEVGAIASGRLDKADVA